MSNPLLFNQLFIDVVKSLFIKYPDKKFSKDDLYNYLPDFYKDYDMINMALHLLTMDGLITDMRLDNQDFYTITPSTLKRIEEEKIKDQAIKDLQHTIIKTGLKRIFMPHVIAIISVFVAIIGIVPDLIKIFRDDTKEVRLMQQTLQVQEETLLNIQKAVEGMNQSIHVSNSDSAIHTAK